jgi:uncharacterized protein YndB with AHSA1/START domain
MSKTRRQAVIEAPVQSVWELVGDPNRHPEWYPKVIEVNGQRFEEGDEYVQVTKDPFAGSSKTDFVIERMEDMREIRFVCQNTGMYAHWLLTDAQGGTFVDVEMGMEPRTVGTRVFDTVAGRMYFRRWLEQSLDALRSAAGRTRSAPPAA